MTDTPFKITPEDAERLRETAAQLSKAVTEAWECIVEVAAEIYQQIGMSYQEATDAINGAIQAAQEAAQAADRTGSRNHRHIRPPRRKDHRLPAVCPSMKKPAPVARSTIYRRSNRQRGR